MDKLKPVLAHKFWILFGLALLLPLYGWWSATGAIKAETAERRATLDGLQIPTGANTPNDTYAAGLKEVNKLRQQLFDTERRRLWQLQKRMMVWPPALHDRYLKDVPYRGELSDATPNGLYKDAYAFELDRLIKIVQPFDVETGEGKLIVASNAFPHVVPADRWQLLPPSWEEMWDAQEDLWLTEGLLTAIANVNQDDASITDASIRQIYRLELMGGNRESLNAAPAGGGAGVAGAEAPGDPMGPGPAMSVFGGGRNMQGGRKAGIDFDPTEEFGSPALAAAGGTGDAGVDPSMDAGMPMAGDMAGGQQGKTRRYVDDDPAMPFKTRAFYIKVQMDHEDLPRFIAELNSLCSSGCGADRAAAGESTEPDPDTGKVKWPVQIVRVHMEGSLPEVGATSRQFAGGGGPDIDAGGGRFGGGGQFRGGRFNNDIGGGRFDNDLGGGAVGEPGVREKAQQKLSVAMSDPQLADVVVAGLIRLYRPIDAAPAAGGDQPADAAQQPGGDPTAVPADGTPVEATPDATTPADPATPATSGTGAPATTTSATPAAETPATPESPGTSDGSEPSDNRVPDAGQPEGTPPQPTDNATPEPSADQTATKAEGT